MELNAASDKANTGDDIPQADTKVFLVGASLLALATFVVVAFVAGFRLPGGATADGDGAPRTLANFSFTERSGRTVTREEMRGKYLIVNFVHTGCSISCAMVNRRMADVQRMVAGQGDVQLLSFTVDPGTDTPAVLGKFAEQFGADANRWLFLTGRKSELYPFIETSFLARETNSLYMAMPGGFLKADHIALVDAAGKVRRFFPGMKLETPAAIVGALEELRGDRASP